MRVSNLELFTHCKKIFEACGVPYGYAEEGAETVANTEFLGLYGLQQLADELSNLQHQLEMPEIVEVTDCVTTINGNNQSGMLLGKACADYVIARLQDCNSAAVYVKNTTPSRALIQQAMYMAKRGFGCLIVYKLPSHTSLIISSPNAPFPIMIHKRDNEDMIDWMNLDLGLSEEKKLKHPSPDEEFCVFGTASVDSVDQVMELFQQTINPSYLITTTEDFEQKWKLSWDNGVEINEELWIRLYEVGKRTLVESTEQSRLRGAGELA